MPDSRFEATDSSLGFYYQSSYSLILLTRSDDDGAVSVETTDDVLLNSGGTPSLHQLKHSMGTPPKLTVKNDGLWNTIGNWLSLRDWPRYEFVFVTCAELSSESNLCGLASTSREGIDAALRSLENEAESVLNPLKKEGHKKSPEHRVRKSACVRFLAISPEERKQFVSKLTLITSSFNAGEIPEQISRHALGMYPVSLRNNLAERLIEWWDRRVARSLLKLSPRQITKLELLEQLSHLHAELREPYLPADFHTKIPDSLDSELGGFMERQIEIVDGGQQRLERAARDRWRARNQRERWLADELAFAEELSDFNDRLIEAWRDKHGPMCDDKARADNDEQKAAGRDMLDWSHEGAALSGIEIREGVGFPFFIRGSLQQLSEELLVGWHPKFEEILDIDRAELRWQVDSNG